MKKMIAAALACLTMVAHARADFVQFGQFYGAPLGETSIYVRLPNNSGTYVDWLQWGYGAESVPPPGWITTESLTAYGVPEGAVAVRLHIKAKAKVVTWATGPIISGLQVKLRPYGDTANRNEVVNVMAMKIEGAAGENNGHLTVEDLDHVTIDVLLGDDHKIDVFRHPSIIGAYANVDLVVMLAGYWKP
jgi:hypothetical protein